MQCDFKYLIHKLEAKNKIICLIISFWITHITPYNQVLHVISPIRKLKTLIFVYCAEQITQILLQLLSCLLLTVLVTTPNVIKVKCNPYFIFRNVYFLGLLFWSSTTGMGAIRMFSLLTVLSLICEIKNTGYEHIETVLHYPHTFYNSTIFNVIYVS